MKAGSEKRKISWLKRVGIAILLLFPCLIVAHQIWSAIAQRNYWKRIDALKAAGQPVEAVDFMTADPASSENAAHDIEAAVKIISGIDSAISKPFDRLSIALPLRPNEKQIIGEMQRHWVPAFKRMESALTRSRLERDFDAYPLALFSREIGPTRQLAMAFAANVLWDHERGEDRHVAKYFDAMLLLSRYEGEYPAMVSHLVSVGMVGLMVQRCAEIAPDLKISATDPSAMSISDAKRVIDALLDEKQAWESMKLAIQGERVTSSELMLSLADGTPISTGAGTVRSSAGPQRYLLKPILYRNGALTIDHLTNLLATIPSENWPKLKASMPALPKASVLNFLSTITLPSTNRFVENQFYGLTDRRLAAVALAIRWYATEHDGRLPMTLDELVPKYIPSVPIDPMSGSGEPIRYIGRAELPIVYSVGLNGVDDKGAETTVRTETATSYDWRTLDHVIHLTRKPRPEPQQDEELEESPFAPAGSPVSENATEIEKSNASRPTSTP